MKSVNPINIILILLGCVLVYGSKNILKLLKFNDNEKNILVIKLIGLLVACIGIFSILQII